MAMFLGALASLVWTLLLVAGVYYWVKKHHPQKDKYNEHAQARLTLETLRTDTARSPRHTFDEQRFMNG